MAPSEPKDIDSYIRNASKETQPHLKKLSSTIRKLVPKAGEKLAWGMPTFTLEGNLIHFAWFKNHVSVFPGSDAIAWFKKDLTKYQTSKGTLQIPLDQPVPVALVSRIVKFCVKRNLAMAAEKAAKKAAKKRK